MNEYELNIFTTYYKRIMRVESTLKALLIDKYTTLYQNNAYRITFTQFFSKTENHLHSKDKIYTKLHTSTKSEQDKFAYAVNEMYLSEIFVFLGHPVFLKNKIRKNFFKVPTKTNTTDFQANAKALKEFRNCIAHINQKKFKIDINRFLKGLEYFERILGFNIISTVIALGQINPRHKLSTSDILNIIYNTNLKVFSDDRELVSIFDEIALLNGYTFENLPQRWTIVRQKYKLEKEKEQAEQAKSQISLFDIDKIN